MAYPWEEDGYFDSFFGGTADQPQQNPNDFEAQFGSLLTPAPEPDQRPEDMRIEDKQTIDRIGKGYGGGGWSDFINLFNKGKYSTDLSAEAGTALVMGNDASKLAQIKSARDYLAKMNVEDDKINLPSVLASTAEVLGGIWGGMRASWAEMLAGVAIGAVVAGPAGAGVGAGRGLAVGSFRYWAAQGAGDTYFQLQEAKVPDDVARKVAIPAGIVYGAVEQITKLIPGQPAILKPFKQALQREIVKSAIRIAARTGLNVAGEMAEEGVQDSVQKIAQNIAADMTMSTEGTPIEKFTKDEIFQSALQQAIAASGPSAILGGTGGAIDMANARNFANQAKALEEQAGLTEEEAQAIFKEAGNIKDESFLSFKPTPDQSENYISKVKKVISDNQEKENAAAEAQLQQNLADAEVRDNYIADISDEIKAEILSNPNADIPALAKKFADARGETVEEVFPEGVDRESLSFAVGARKEELDLSDEKIGAKRASEYLARRKELIKQLGDKPTKKQIKKLDKALKEQMTADIPKSAAARQAFFNGIKPPAKTPEQVIEEAKAANVPKPPKAAKTKAGRAAATAKPVASTEGGMQAPVKASPVKIQLSDANGTQVEVTQDKPFVAVNGEKAREFSFGPDGMLKARDGGINENGVFVPDKSKSSWTVSKNEEGMHIAGKGFEPISSAKATSRLAQIKKGEKFTITGSDGVVRSFVMVNKEKKIEDKEAGISRTVVEAKNDNGDTVFIKYADFANSELGRDVSKRQGIGTKESLNKTIGETGAEVGGITIADDGGKAKSEEAAAAAVESSIGPGVYGDEEVDKKLESINDAKAEVAEFINTSSKEDIAKLNARVKEIEKEDGVDIATAVRRAMLEIREDYSTPEKAEATLSLAKKALAKMPNDEVIQATVAKATREVGNNPERGALAKKNEEYTALSKQLETEKKYLAKLPSLESVFGKEKTARQTESRKARIAEIEARMSEISGSIPSKPENIYAAALNGKGVGESFVSQYFDSLAGKPGSSSAFKTERTWDEAKKLVDAGKITDTVGLRSFLESKQKDIRASKRIAASNADPLQAIRTEAAIKQSAARVKGAVEGSITRDGEMKVILPGGMFINWAFKTLKDNIGQNERVRDKNGRVIGWNIYLDPRDASPVTVWHEGSAGHAAMDMLDPIEKIELTKWLKREGIFDEYRERGDIKENGKQIGWWNDKWTDIEAADEILARYVSENIKEISRFAKQQTPLGRIWAKVKQILEALTGGRLFSGARDQAEARRGESLVAEIASGKVMQRNRSSVSDPMDGSDIRNVGHDDLLAALHKKYPKWSNAKLQYRADDLWRQLYYRGPSDRAEGIRNLAEIGADDLVKSVSEEYYRPSSRQSITTNPDGTPKVFEHWSDSEKIDRFDFSKIGEGSGDYGYYGAGAYFSASGKGTPYYGKNKHQFYLYLKNTLTEPSKIAVPSDIQGTPRAAYMIRRKAMEMGYDSALIGDTLVVYDLSKIRPVDVDVRASKRSSDRSSAMEKTLSDFKRRLLEENGEKWRESSEWKSFVKGLAKSDLNASAYYSEYARKKDFEAGINIVPEADVQRHVRGVERDNPTDVVTDVTNKSLLGRMSTEYKHTAKNFVRGMIQNLPAAAKMVSDEFGREVYKRMRDSGIAYRAIQLKALDVLKKNNFDKIVFDFKPDDAVQVRVPGNSGTVKITKGMLLSLVRLTQNVHGRDALMAGGYFGIEKNGPKLKAFANKSEGARRAMDAELEAWGKAMLARDSQMNKLNSMMTDIMDNEIFPELARVYNAITGKTLKKESAYIAIQRLGELNTEAENTGTFARLLTDWKALDSRTMSDRPILIGDATSSMQNSIDRAAKFVGYAENLRYLRGLLGSSLEDSSGEAIGSFADTIDQKLGAGTAKYILRQIQSVEGVVDPQDYKFIRRLLQRQDVARLAGPQTALKQWGSIFMPLLSVSPRSVFKGISMTMDSDLFKKVMDSDRGSVIKYRMEQSLAAEELAESKHNRSRLERQVEKKAFWLMRSADAATVKYYFKIATAFVNEEHPELRPGSVEYIHKIADKTTEMINDYQPTGMNEYRTALHNSGLLGMLFNRYRTSVNAINATLYRKYLDYKRNPGRNSRANLYASLALPIIAQAVFFASADALVDEYKDQLIDWWGDDDEKKQKNKEKKKIAEKGPELFLANKTISNLLMQAPQGAQLVNALGPVIEYLTTRRKNYMGERSNFNTGMDPFDDFYKGVRSANAAMIKMAEADESGKTQREKDAAFAKAARNAIDASMKITQYMPVGNVLPQLNRWLGISRMVESSMRD